MHGAEPIDKSQQVSDRQSKSIVLKYAGGI